MKLTMPMAITAADDSSRTISGRIVAFDELANASTGKVIFTENSIEPKNVFLNLEHDATRRIGKTLSMVKDSNRAINASFKIFKTSAGSDAIVEAMEGARDGFSVELKVDDYETTEDGTMKVLKAELTGVALVTNPAVKSAKVSDVSANQNSEVEKISEPVTPNPTEGETQVADNNVKPEAPTEETTVEASQININAVNKPVFTTRPRLDFSAGKYLENTIRASLGDEDARQYVAAAADTTDNAGLVPTRQLNEVINGLANGTRSNIDAISRGVLPDAGFTFEIPKISQLPSVAITAEAGTPSETDQNAAFVTVSVEKFAGQQTFSVELLDRTSPLFFNELLSNMSAVMAKAQDSAVNAAIMAGATDDATTVATYPTATELLGIISRGSASVYNGTQRFARNIIMNTSQWANAMTLNNNGAPLYNVAAGTNNFTGGQVNPTSIRGNIAGLDLYVTANTEATGDLDGSILIVNPEAYTWYESGSYRLRADVIASGQISVMVYSYGAIATKIGAGAFKLNKTA
jgi:HK97 family phage prohead protease